MIDDDYAYELQKKWESNIPRFSDAELLNIFPEIMNLVPSKITELEEARQQLIVFISEALKGIRQYTDDQNSLWFLREGIKLDLGQELVNIENKITHFQWLNTLRKRGKSTENIAEDKVQKVLAVPIERVVSRIVQLHRSGKNLKGLCPLHKERSASFFIYPETNRFWCFGCNTGGNSINLIQQMYNLSFKEAVQYLHDN